MVDKKEVIQNWPLETGDFSVGDPNSPVAVVSLGSNMNDELVDAGAAVSGPLHTENLGIEKVVANVISNSNIRFVLICGSEVQGHITGKTVEALYDNGIDEEKKSIIGSPGAIPFVENLPMEAVERFQDQVSIISMINNENIDDISSKIEECIANDPGPYSEDAMIIEFNEAADDDEEDTQEASVEEEDSIQVDSSAMELLEVETRVRLMHNQVNQIASLEKISSGYYAGKIEGIVIGFIVTLVLVIIIIFRVVAL